MMMPMFTFPSGTIVPTALEITVPTPALVNTAPREAKALATCLTALLCPAYLLHHLKMYLVDYLEKRTSRLAWLQKHRRPRRLKAPKLVNRANKIAKTPILKAGIKIFIPSLSDIFPYILLMEAGFLLC